ncbi:SDR family oxidoreductase [Govanella unica]|uniref:SDR family oxidoreductase n=1 Tax=Govanella unica TaxID=2975056 RepID=A0A9X3TZT4_9PROT|nr:SDR family oxidoreductase [Govania unica]MDA5194789.1 SDR family oxidoreductase [Govania unica]
MSTVQNAALVTGAAHRVGRALATDLAAHGWAVAIHCHRSVAAAEALAADIRAGGGKAAVVTADLASEDETAGLIAATTDAVGPLRLLVNNASLFEDDSWETATRESYEAHMATNLRAPFLLSQGFAAQAPDHSVIVNIIDQRVWRLTPKFLSYTLSKAGLWTLTQTLAQALAPRIRVNAIGPGPVLPSSRQSLESFDAQVAALPLGASTGLKEICAALRFILETPSMTGQMIALDGGQHLSWQTPDVMVQE